MRTRFTSAFLGVLIVPAFLNSAPAQTPDEVVEKHLAALGGRAALAKLTSRKSIGTVTIATPAGNLTGPIEISLKAPNKTRAKMELDLTALGGPGAVTVEQKFDGTAGRSTNSMQGDVEITGNQLQNMRNNTFPTPLLTYKEAGTKLEVLPKEQVGGRDAIVLLITPKAGPPVRFFLDAETYLVVKAVVKSSSPDMGDFDQISEPSDYRTVDGVKVPFAVKTTNPAQNLTIKLDKVEHNVALDDAIFAVKAPAAEVTAAVERASWR
jgi:outer membrane lipoprotein-sorting protein